ncbi:ADP-ribose glycohydrolase oard1 [Mactra antiquata]
MATYDGADDHEDVVDQVTAVGGSKFSLLHVKGDLFSCDESESLAHCVSKDMCMGKGIAKLFKAKFNGVTELKKQDKGVGDVAVIKKGGRYIYYLVTKVKYNHKPTYDTLKSSLKAMKDHGMKNNVTGISMPRIGCGLDRLQWPKVEEMLKGVFKDTDIVITVYSI